MKSRRHPEFFLNITKATFFKHKGKNEDTEDTERSVVYV